jgi:hypothetical protein
MFCLSGVPVDLPHIDIVLGCAAAHKLFLSLLKLFAISNLPSALGLFRAALARIYKAFPL